MNCRSPLRVLWLAGVMSLFRQSAVITVLAAGNAFADPAPSQDPAAAPVVISLPLFEKTPPKPVPSLRLEAVRIAGEQFLGEWRLPEPSPLVGFDSGAWFIGYGHYRPRTARSASLHGGSIAATMLGQILLSADSPVAGVGALLTGATLDAAGADADRDAEARRKH